MFGWKKDKKKDNEEKDLVPMGSQDQSVQKADADSAMPGEHSEQHGLVKVTHSRERTEQLDEFDPRSAQRHPEKWLQTPGVRNAWGVCQEIGCQYNSVQDIRKQNKILQENYGAIERMLLTTLRKVDTMLYAESTVLSSEYKEFWEKEFRPEIYRRLEDMGCQVNQTSQEDASSNNPRGESSTGEPS